MSLSTRAWPVRRSSHRFDNLERACSWTFIGLLLLPIEMSYEYPYLKEDALNSWLIDLRCRIFQWALSTSDSCLLGTCLRGSKFNDIPLGVKGSLTLKPDFDRTKHSTHAIETIWARWISYNEFLKIHKTSSTAKIQGGDTIKGIKAHLLEKEELLPLAGSSKIAPPRSSLGVVDLRTEPKSFCIGIYHKISGERKNSSIHGFRS
ncbi:hypothetical protein VNO77_03244 [Canavalia gladiata]|uniref:Uncharacterized protein n=1 Tax=Canavalia gladiata TaxID=3824 RepID=A0AAN9MV10_CANGL